MRFSDPSPESTSEATRRLAEIIQQVEHRGLSPRQGGLCLPTGWEAVDRTLGALRPQSALPGGLARGAVHEWLGLDGSYRQGWFPPLSVLAHLASRAIRAAREGEAQGVVVWVGRRCWPHPPALLPSHADLIARSVYVDPGDASARQWAIELCLRSPAVAAVVADGSGLGMAQSRRLQLTAEAGVSAGGGGIALLARPLSETGVISAAATRWIVRREITPALSRSPPQPRWSIELSRCKGSASRNGAKWVLEGGDETGVVCLPADVVDRPDLSARTNFGLIRSA